MASPSFQWSGVLPARVRLEFYPRMRQSLRRIEIRRLDLSFDNDVRRSLGMNVRRAGGKRAARIGHRGERLDFDLDAIGDILSLLLARRDHGSDQFADKTHDVRGQDRLRYRDVVELVQHRLNRL